MSLFFALLIATAHAITLTPTKSETYSFAGNLNSLFINEYGPFQLPAGQSAMVSGLNLQMQADGNLVLYRQGVVVWAASSSPSLDGQPVYGRSCASCTANFLADGNLVLKNSSGVAYWSTDTAGGSGALLRISSLHPYLEIVRGSDVIYQSNKKLLTNGLFSSFILFQGQSITSGSVMLKMQSDGNLVIYKNPTTSPVALWSSNTFGASCSQVCSARFQADGNFVLYNGLTAFWSTNSSGQGLAELQLSLAAPYLDILRSRSKLLFDDYQGNVSTPNCFSNLLALTNHIYYYKSVFASGLGQQIKLRAHILTPSNPTNKALPAIVLFHGGGWENGSPMNMHSQALYWASRGLVVINFEYRLFNPKYGWASVHDATADATSAIRWIRKYAGQLSVDSNRIITLGESAGGHLALVPGLTDFDSNENLADRTISSVPNEVFGMYPVVDVTLLTADTRRASTPNLSAISPLHLVLAGKAAPRTFLYVGADESMWLTPLPTAQNFCSSVNSATPGRCTFNLVQRNPDPNVGVVDHDFMAKPEYYRPTVASIDLKLRQLGYLGGNPNDSLSSVTSLVSSSGPNCSQYTNSLITNWNTLYGY